MMAANPPHHSQPGSVWAGNLPRNGMLEANCPPQEKTDPAEVGYLIRLTVMDIPSGTPAPLLLMTYKSIEE